MRLCSLARVCGTAAVLLFSFSASIAAQDNQEWITINKDYSSQRYVDLDQINTGNVSALKPVCEAHLNEPSWFSSGVLMVERTLYVSTLRATYAVDAATCEVRWRDVIKLGPTANISNRGPAYLNGMIFRGTADGRVIALDAKSGKVMWDQRHVRPKTKWTRSSLLPLLGTARCSSASPSAIWEFAAV